MNIGCSAEYDPIQIALVKLPGREFSQGTILPDSSLYEGSANLYNARKEHQNYKQQLARTGAQVYDVAELLLQGAIDTEENPVDGNALSELREQALASLQQMYRGVPEDEQKKVRNKLRLAVELKHPTELVDIILSRPEHTIHFRYKKDPKYEGSIVENPLYNIMFCRDQMITTDKGVIIGAMKEEVRQCEISVMEFVLQKLGIQPLYKIQKGTLEGGDFIPAGKIGTGQTLAFLGQGLRTNAEAIEELIENSATVFGYDYIAVVKDKFCSMDQMHLDTYFNIVGRQRALVIQESAFTGNAPVVDLYEHQQSGGYSPIPKQFRFYPFLKEAGFELLEVPTIMQRNYGLNFLTVQENRIIGVDIRKKQGLREQLQAFQQKYDIQDPLLGTDFAKLGEDYRNLLEDFGIQNVEESLLPFTHLNRAYGGPHCLTQVLARG